jgi:hypothetical protein
LAFTDVLLEIYSLIDSTREPIDQVVLGGVSDEPIDEDLNSELEGDEASFVHDLSDSFAVTCALKLN